MVILSKLADYGVIIATRLAATEGLRANAAQLAAETRLPATTVAKIMKLLAKKGIVTALRGALGGYRLAHAPEDIKLSDVVAAIDGNFALTQCTSHVAPCDRHTFCTTRPHWPLINQAVEQALSNVTLADMKMPAPVPFMTLFPLVQNTKLEAAL